MGTFMKSKSQTQLLTELRETTHALAAVSLAVKNTEYPYSLPTDTKAYQFQCRTEYDVRYAFESGKVASAVDPYWTLKAGDVIYKDHLVLAAATLCLGADTAGLKVEVEAWF